MSTIACYKNYSIKVGCPFDAMTWTPPNISFGAGGAGSASAVANTINLHALSGTGTVCHIDAMNGSMVYTGGAFDGYLHFTVTLYDDKPTGPFSAIRFDFEVRQNGVLLGSVSADPVPTNSISIVDADGPRVEVGALPGTITLRLHVTAAVAATITVQATGTYDWAYVLPGPVFPQQCELTYKIVFDCAP